MLNVVTCGVGRVAVKGRSVCHTSLAGFSIVSYYTEDTSTGMEMYRMYIHTMSCLRLTNLHCNMPQVLY